MKQAFFALTLFAFGGLSIGGAFAAAPAKAKLPDKPLAAETAFVTGQTADLNAKYKTPADAEKAGYFRYTNEDSTGAISYANLHWNSAADSAHPQPSQLWYDVNGHLLGADYSVPLTAANSASPPKLWGLNPGRWMKFGKAHVHYILKNDRGVMSYGHAVRAAAFVAAGGSLANPSPASIVKMKKAEDPDDVAKVFTFPAQWDVEIWVTPNPLGAFAGNDPLVHPSKAAAKGEM